MQTSIGRNIMILARQLNNFLSQELIDSDLTATELTYLGVLSEHDGVSQDYLSQTLVIDKAATTRTIRGLENKGLVVRKADESDRRAKRVFLTKQADQYKDEIAVIQKKWGEILHLNASDADLATVDRFLTQAVDHLRK